MKPLYPIFAALLLPFTTTAQTGVLTAAEMLPAGSEYTAMVLDPVSTLDTTSGAGVVWQNGHLTFTAAALTISVLAPGGTTWGANFPQANYCLYESVVARHSYFTLSPQQQARVGFHRNAVIGTYSDPQVEMVFPMQLGTSNMDDWANNAVSLPGTYAFEVIGTGDLVLPFGTYQDVLLVRVDVVNLFSLQQYMWMSAEHGAALLVYTMQSGFGAASGQITTSITVGIDENAAPITFRLHEASGGVLPVSYASNEPVTYHIRDVAGRLLTTGHLPASATARTEMLDITAVAQGVHLLELATAHGRAVERFFVGR